MLLLTREQLDDRRRLTGACDIVVVTGLEQNRVSTRVIHGGPISSKKGMTFPDSELTIPGDAPQGADLREDYSAQSPYFRLRDARSEAAVRK